MEQSKKMYPVDIEILKYLKDNISIDKQIGLTMFGSYFDEAINLLVNNEYVEDVRNKTLSTDKAQYLGLYTLTPKGSIYLHDFEWNEKNIDLDKAHDYHVAKYSGKWGAIFGCISGIITSLLVNIILYYIQ